MVLLYNFGNMSAFFSDRLSEIYVVIERWWDGLEKYVFNANKMSKMLHICYLTEESILYNGKWKNTLPKIPSDFPILTPHFTSVMKYRFRRYLNVQNYFKAILHTY